MGPTFSQRKFESRWFYEEDELPRTFRGVLSKAIPHLQRHTSDHWRLQRQLGDTTLYNAMNGDEAWGPVVEAVQDLLEEVQENPRKFCQPPEIPEDWESARNVIAKYAPSPWWYDVLKLSDEADGKVIAKKSSWQSQLSRDTTPRQWPIIRQRVLDWRARVLEALERWEVRRAFWEHGGEEVAYSMAKDALDAGDRDTAINITRDWLQLQGRLYRAYAFDPADPERTQFGIADQAKTTPEEQLQRWLNTAPQYRPPDPPDAPQREVVRRGIDHWHDFDTLSKYWDQESEYLNFNTWNPIKRKIDVETKPHRVRVRIPAKYAEPGEEILTAVYMENEPIYGAGELAEVVVKFKKVERTREYVLRWRQAHQRDVSFLNGLPPEKWSSLK